MWLRLSKYQLIIESKASTDKYNRRNRHGMQLQMLSASEIWTPWGCFRRFHPRHRAKEKEPQRRLSCCVSTHCWQEASGRHHHPHDHHRLDYSLLVSCNITRLLSQHWHQCPLSYLNISQEHLLCLKWQWWCFTLLYTEVFTILVWLNHYSYGGVSPSPLGY